MGEKQENAIEEKALDETKEEKKRKKKEAKKAKRKKGNYITGTIGAFLGGLVASIPWIIVYTLVNGMVIPPLALLIVGGAFLGYKIFNGKVGKYLPAIIIVASLVVIIITTTIICPIILLIKWGYQITIDNWLGLYSDVREEIRTSIIQDTIVAIVFVALGIAGLMRLIKTKLKEKIAEEEQSPKQQKAYQKAREKLLEQTETVKKACTTISCTKQENAITKKELLNAIQMSCNLKRRKAKKYLKMCLAYKLIKKYKGKYYYDEADEENKLQNVKKFKHISTRKIRIIITLIIIVLVAIAICLIYIKENYYVLADTNIILTPNKDQDFYGTADQIMEKYGETASKYYDFIMEDKEKTYELYGQKIPKSQYGEKSLEEIIQEERATYEPYIGEDAISKIIDKTLGSQNFKSYTFTYIGTNGNQYKASIYLCEDNENYLWINVYADFELEYETIDEIVDKLIN